MKKCIFVLCFLLMICWSIQAHSVPITLIEQGAEWQYATTSVDLWPIWNTATSEELYNSFAWGSASWSTGNAAFGNASTFTTLWLANTDLALQKIVTLSSPLNTAIDVTLNAASDNGFAVFVNGTIVARENAEGFTSYWEYTLSIDNSYFSVGNNIVQVLAEDHGGSTFFDMQMTGDTSSVPEPSALLLLFTGMIGLVATKKKFKA